MATVDLVMPKMGESIMEATILKWHKHPGDHVKMDETVLEIATDKVDTEVPSTAEGTLEEILYDVNDVVPVGSVIARIKTSVDERGGITGEDSSNGPRATINQPQGTYGQPVNSNQQPTANDQQPMTISHQPASNGNGRFYSPLV